MDINKVRSEGAAAGKVSDTRIREGNAAKGTGKVDKTKSVDGAQSTRETSSTSTEKVRLSGDVEVACEGVAAAHAAPDVRADKVAGLKEQIRKGAYKVDNQAIADRMLQASLEEDVLTRSE
jgi:flagellar biosynthesis anti-sigma factor FlgM